MSHPFHYAFFVRDLASTRRFYGEILGCLEGRSTDTWVDFDFFGNQISAHTTGAVTPTQDTGQVEGIQVPMPHFGALLEWNEFSALADRIRGAGIAFIVEPRIRSRGSRESRRPCSFSTPAATRSSSRASDIRSISSLHENGLGRHHRCGCHRRERGISPRAP